MTMYRVLCNSAQYTVPYFQCAASSIYFNVLLGTPRQEFLGVSNLPMLLRGQPFDSEGGGGGGGEPALFGNKYSDLENAGNK